jgi:hypothetical protein
MIPSPELDRKVRDYMAKSGEASYSAAIKHVLRTDAALASWYVAFAQR